LSTEVTARGLTILLDAIQSLAVDLLCEGYFVRGAIVKGRLYHDEHMVFGEALVRAFEFESEQARFPRIVVLSEVRDDMISYGAQGLSPKTDRLRASEDGPMYLDVLQSVASLGRKGRHPYEKLTQQEKIDHARYATIRNKIQDRFARSMDTPHHFEKVQWFARYWNDIVARDTDFGRILGGGLR
jgi:hypothetical protein